MTDRNHNTDAQWQTCPSCGKKSRSPDHPLCSRCNKIYSEQATEAVANLEDFPNRVEWAYQMGLRTLAQMQEEHKEVSAVTRPVLERAGREISESLGKRIDSKVFHDARLKRYRSLLEEVSPEVKEAAERERQLFAAICSLKSFLQDIESRSEKASEEDRPVAEEEVE